MLQISRTAGSYTYLQTILEYENTGECFFPLIHYTCLYINSTMVIVPSLRS